MACIDLGGFCDCVPSGGPCGVMAGPPLCYGDCPPATPICADMAGVCMCTIPTLSEWGIIGMSVAMLAAVLIVGRRREAQLLA
jgi:hypothetical protein